MAFLVGGANSAADTGYDIDNSLRYNDDDNPMLSLSMSSGNQQIFTVAAWVKRGGLTGENQRIFSSDDEASADWRIRFNGADKLEFVDTYSGDSATYTQVYTTRLFRDTSAWYHIVVAVDTTQGTASNRVKMYVNGVQATDLDDGTGSSTKYPAEDDNLGFGRSGTTLEVGASLYSSSPRQSFDGYIAEVYVVDGTQYAASDFGETDEDSGIWKPKDAKDDLTFGTNGFFLEFKETGTDQDSSGMGADTSGEDNHLAVTNLAATDQSTDTPTNNFCTFNPLTATGGTYSEGNTIITTGSDASRNERGTFGMDSGKWYWEYKLAGSSINNIYLGIGTTDTSVGAEQTGTYTYYSADSTGRIYTGGSIVDSPTAFAVDDIVSIAYNADDNQVLFYLNGVLEYTTSSVTDVTYNPFARIYYTTSEVQANFGNPSFAISSGNADANGYGNFEYAVPNGYYALCTKNLAEYG
jgi:hypothetical protein